MVRQLDEIKTSNKYRPCDEEKELLDYSLGDRKCDSGILHNFIMYLFIPILLSIIVFILFYSNYYLNDSELDPYIWYKIFIFFILAFILGNVHQSWSRTQETCV